jgi:hypothetical protein
LGTIINLLKQERPLQFFSAFALIFSLVSIALAVPIVGTYLETGLVPRFPTAILSSALMLLAFLFFFSGLILQTVTRGRQEAKRMRYLAVPGAHATLGGSEGQD